MFPNLVHSIAPCSSICDTALRFLGDEKSSDLVSKYSIDFHGTVRTNIHSAIKLTKHRSRCFTSAKIDEPVETISSVSSQSLSLVDHHHPNPTQEQEPKIIIPPPFLYGTASSHVYVAACAMDEKYKKDPKQLFGELYQHHTKDSSKTRTKFPVSFQPSCRYEYISPQMFDYSLPTYTEVDNDDNTTRKRRIPEVAFLGRSNVGKSSLVNSLTRTKHLARISKTPGRTQQVNYFAILPSSSSSLSSSLSLSSTGKKKTPKTSSSTTSSSSSSFPFSHVLGYLIDLPGYGYANAPLETVDQWQKTTQDFLLQRRHEVKVLQRLYILIDSRHGMTPLDRLVMRWLEDVAIPYCVVLTKADRANRPMLVRFANEICMRYHSQMHSYGNNMDNDDSYTECSQSPLVHITSSKTGEGMFELMWSIDRDLSGQHHILYER